MTMQTEAEAMAPRLYEKVTTDTRNLVLAVQAGQWHDPTPCTDWDVTQLTNHLVSSARNIAGTMAGDGPQNYGDVPGDDTLLVAGRGEQAAGNYALGQVQEMLVDGWDLAIATGQDATMDAELLEESTRARCATTIACARVGRPRGARERRPWARPRTCWRVTWAY